ncbi:MAG TPA: hypothetical protein CFH84_10760 [Sulfurimonas sp. UBA12504]|nr:MAG: hypothetical protein A2019_06565 [Sulfurimonas sp. GWF2_37_8]DAB29196.1 MAG TPA: hypothetical protein CFH84_10760 [Sulfurimonas sp. UBA12504]
MNIADVIGVLGFVLALFTFVLTRWERRRKLSIEFFTDHGRLFKDERGDNDEGTILVARLINTGGKPIIVNRESFVFIGNNKKVEWHRTDVFGKETFPSPLNPGDKAEIGIYVNSFAELLGAATLDKIKLSLELKDINRHNYKLGKNFTLLLEVDEVTMDT